MRADRNGEPAFLEGVSGARAKGLVSIQGGDYERAVTGSGIGCVGTCGAFCMSVIIRIEYLGRSVWGRLEREGIRLL